MRKILLLGFIIITNVALAQKKDTVGLHTPFANDQVAYQKSFKAANKSKGQLYSASQSWYEKRYKDADSLKIQDSSNGILTGRAWEALIFKGPIGMNVPSRVGFSVAVNSNDGMYTVHVSNILIAYQEQPGVASVFFTAEDLMNHILGKKYPKGVFDPVPFSKKRAKKVLISLNELVEKLMVSAGHL